MFPGSGVQPDSKEEGGTLGYIYIYIYIYLYLYPALFIRGSFKGLLQDI